MDTSTDILLARVCPYCGQQPKFVDSIEIYGNRSFGKIYLCRSCDAYVGVHKGTEDPLGRLANKELRELKVKAHYWFDRLWKDPNGPGCTRREAYDWLSQKMGIPLIYTHIGMFDEEQCRQAILVCQAKYPDIPNKKLSFNNLKSSQQL